MVASPVVAPQMATRRSAGVNRGANCIEQVFDISTLIGEGV